MYRKACCLIGCLLVSYILPGQLYPKRHFRTEDGLIQKQVTTLFEDSHGALWIGTKGGVTRFDGHETVSWTVQDGLESNLVKAFSEDLSGGVLVYSDTGVTRIWKKRTSVLLSGKFFEIFRATNDSAGYSYFLANSPPGSLYICDPAGKIDLYPFLERFHSTAAELWKSKQNSEVLLKDSKGAYYLLKQGMVNPVSDLESRPWLNHPKLTDESLMNEFRNLFWNSGNAGFLPFELNGTKTVFHPSAGFFWCSHTDNNKLFLKSKSGNELIDYPFHYVTFLLLDRRMQVWVGTENGLVVFHHLLFRNFINPDLLTDPWALVGGENDEIYVGNYGDKLAEIRANKISPAQISVNLSQNQEDAHAILHYYPGGVTGFRDEVYLNTSRGVLTIRDRALQRTVPLPLEPVYTSFKDTLFNRILFSSFGNGIFSWSENNKSEPVVICRNPVLSRIYSIGYGPGGQLFFGSENAVAVAEGQTYRFFRDSNGDSIRGAYSMSRDTKGNLWFGNDYGLFVYNGEKIERISHEFLNRSVRATRMISGNRLLIGTSEGIGVLFLNGYEPGDRLQIKWYDYRNGFEGGEVGINGLYADRQGIIWIAGSRGVIRMDPDWIRLDTIPVMAEIQTVQVSNNWSEWHTKDPGSDGIYTLSHQQNQVRIVYRGINLKTPLRDFYIYRLVGLNDQWCSPTQEITASYTNLRHGNYTFEVKVRNKDELYNQNPTSVKIKIIPAWYQTRFFLICILILSLSAIVLLTYSLTRYSQRLKLKKLTKEREIAELRLATIRSQLEPHFVFNLLNSIGYAIRANETDLAYDHLTKFSGLMRKWLKSSEESMITLEAELSLVSEYLDLEKFRFEERLNYSIDIAEGVPLDLKIPRMILQIPVENAVKHGLENLKAGGVLLINISPFGNGVRILVQDNGIGREAAAQRSSAGNRKGMKLLEKMLEHVSEFNQYIVSFRIMDLHDSHGLPSGTAVEINVQLKED